MPIIAIGAAIASVSSVGVAGFGAVLAGTASLGTTFAAIGAVGATLGAIGEVAGIDELKTAGMVLGGIGGVGALASTVGAFGEGATLNSVFGSGGSAAEGAAGGWSVGADGAISNSSGALLGSSNISTPLLNSGASSMDIISAANKIGGFGMNGFKADQSLATTADPSKDPLAASVRAPDASQTKYTSQAADFATQPMAGADGTADGANKTTVKDPLAAKTTGSGSGVSSSVLGSSITGSVNGPPPNPQLGAEWTNPDTGATYSFDGKSWTAKPGFWGSNGALLGMGVLQSAGSFLSGAFDPLKPAQAEAYSAQAKANDAQAALENKKLSNMNDNIPVARRLNVTGGTGIINQGATA